MEPRTLLLLTAAVFATAGSPSLAAVKYPFTEARLHDEIVDHHPVLIDITASWCPVCKVQKAVIENALLTRSNFSNYVILDVDFDTQQKVVRRLQAFSQSTLIFIRDGREVARLVGVTDKAEIEAMMQRAEN